MLFSWLQEGANLMRPIMILFAVAASLPVAVAQRPIPDKPCQYERLSVLRRVKEPGKFQMAFRFPPKSPDLTYTFPAGTIVSVSRQHDGWSCVYGSRYTEFESAPNGWEGVSGWIPTSQLEKPAEAPSSAKKP
jgi:hypothetical protein